MVEIELPYYLSLPAAPPPWPGVVVIHEGNGMSQQLLRVCERLAAEGYATIAPDLFFRTGGPPPMPGSAPSTCSPRNSGKAASDLSVEWQTVRRLAPEERLGAMPDLLVVPGARRDDELTRTHGGQHEVGDGERVGAGRCH